MRSEGSGTISSRLDWQLVVRFHTSSVEKYLQARALFQRRGLSLGYFRESQEPYREEYERGQTALLQEALDEIRRRMGANTLFFVEDTSVRVDALSGSSDAFPGLRVKEWFKETTFDDLDAELKRRGNNRAATVYSDIGLYVPELGRAVFVHGETTGVICSTAPRFKMSYKFPWLTPSTFNGWFVPRGSDKTLGAMGFEESLAYDFRSKSLSALLDRLEEYVAVIGAPRRFYTMTTASEFHQEWLFPKQARLLVVIGRVCAGKTTFGQYVGREHGRLHVEASDELQEIAKVDGTSENGDAFERARQLLERRGPDVVARNIALKYHERLEDGAVITGFRAIEEVTYFRHRYPSSVVVFINAGDRTRFARHLERGRLDGIKTFEEFELYDRQQWTFGLLGRARQIVDLPRDLADVQIDNERSLEGYYGQIDSLLDGVDRPQDLRTTDEDLYRGPGVFRVRSEGIERRRSFRCLESLEKCRGLATCAEIRAGIIQRSGTDEISTRHVNWVLANLPALVKRDTTGKRLRYEILSAGRAYVEAVRTSLSRTRSRAVPRRR